MKSLAAAMFEDDCKKVSVEARQAGSMLDPTSRAFWMKAVMAAACGVEGLSLDEA